jgi:hypothetical protein
MEAQINHLAILFFHIAGIVIGLGAVTVIDTMGFLSKKSKYWVQVTVRAHHVTKPLIWIGTGIVTITWILMLFFLKNLEFKVLKSLIIIILILNGIFLSFHVSSRVDKLKDKKVFFPKDLQIKTIFSMVISFISWWSFVLVTLIQILSLS